MAIKKDTILAWAKALKIDTAKVEAALVDAGEVDVPMDETLVIMPKADAETRDRNKYNEGKKAGEGMLVDGLFEEHGLVVTGKKDKDSFVKAYQEKVLKEANVSVDDKVREKDTTIKQLRDNLKAKDQELAQRTAKEQELKLNTDLLSWTLEHKPDNFTNEEWTTIIRMNNELVEHEGVLAVKRNGEVVKDPTTLAPIAAKDAVLKFIEERKLGKQKEEPRIPGRAGTDSKVTPGATITSFKQFKEHMKETGESLNGQVAQAKLAELTKNNPNFDMSN